MTPMVSMRKSSARKRRTVLSWVLAAALAVSMIPLGGFADGEGGAGDPAASSDTPVLEINPVEGGGAGGSGTGGSGTGGTGDNGASGAVDPGSGAVGADTPGTGDPEAPGGGTVDPGSGAQEPQEGLEGDDPENPADEGDNGALEGSEGSEEANADDPEADDEEADPQGADSKLVMVASGSVNDNTIVLGDWTDLNDDTFHGIAFDPDTLTYNLGNRVLGTNNLYMQASFPNATTKVTWTDNGSSRFKPIDATGYNLVMVDCMKGYGVHEFKVEVTPNDPAQPKTVYTFTMGRLANLTSLSWDTGYLSPDFNASTYEYTLSLPAGTESVTFTAKTNKNCTIAYNGSDNSTVPTVNGQDILITVTGGEGAAALQQVYRIHVAMIQDGALRLNVTPAEARVVVYDPAGAIMVPEADGSYNGSFELGGYTYAVTCHGYLGQTGQIPTSGGTLQITLEKAPDSGLEPVDSEWNGYRNSSDNMGITDAATPIDPEQTGRIWTVKLNSGGASGSLNFSGVPALIDGALVIPVGNQLYKVDPNDGSVLAQVTMAESRGYAYCAPVCAEGMIFVALTKGKIQAFNAKTLEPLWLYTDPAGGQGQCQITYADGYLYTGFWTGDNKVANYVCLSVTDEDPSRGDEPKTATWSRSHKGGYYWASSVMVGSTLVFGSDASDNAAEVYAVDSITGQVLDTLPLAGMDNQRSAMAYSGGRVYFSTTAGYLCSAAVDATTGKFSDFKSVKYGAHSTSTPVVYKGYVYFGVGSGMGPSGTTGQIVIADAATLQPVKVLDMKGEPQCGVLLSTAYEESTGYLYLYSTYNSPPGGISLVKVKASDPSDAQVVELYDAAGYSQYCYMSVICDSKGNLYYHNDSDNLMALGLGTPDDPVPDDPSDDPNVGPNKPNKPTAGGATRSLGKVVTKKAARKAALGDEDQGTGKIANTRHLSSAPAGGLDSSEGNPLLVWGGIGLAALGALAILFLLGKRSEDEDEEQAAAGAGAAGA